MLDLRSGTSTDYAMHEAAIKYSFTIELRDTGTQGFLLSPSYIDTTGLEVFEMVKSMAEYIWTDQMERDREWQWKWEGRVL